MIKNLIDEAFDESNDIEEYYKYDDKSNFYLPNSRVNSNRDSFPIVLNFGTKLLFLKIDIMGESC